MIIPSIRIIDGQDVVDRAMNDAEFAQYQLDIAESEALASAKAAKETARQAVLERLGITSEEAQLLLGGI